MHTHTHTHINIRTHTVLSSLVFYILYIYIFIFAQKVIKDVLRPGPKNVPWPFCHEWLHPSQNVSQIPQKEHSPLSFLTLRVCVKLTSKEQGRKKRDSRVFQVRKASRKKTPEKVLEASVERCWCTHGARVGLTWILGFLTAPLALKNLTQPLLAS